MSYTHWYLPNNEPNNFTGNDPAGESALELGRFFDDPRAWNDMDPHTINYTNQPIPGYIIEWNSNPESSPIPEPATVLLLASGLGGVFIRKNKT